MNFKIDYLKSEQSIHASKIKIWYIKSKCYKPTLEINEHQLLNDIKDDNVTKITDNSQTIIDHAITNITT